MRSWFIASAALSLAACSSAGDDGRSSAKISEIEWTTQSGGQTTLGRVEISYAGDRVEEASYRLNGMDAGRMEFDYKGTQVDAIDLIDADGDRATYHWSYDDGRLDSIQLVVQQIAAMELEFDYDDANGGRPRRTTTTSWPGAQQTTMVETYDYDDQGRLEEISAIDGDATWSSEIRYDDASRIERFTRYVGNDFTDADLTYDAQGRVELVESNDGDRYELTYGANGLIEEILILAPSANQTTTITYRYVEGTVDGLTFNPQLPLAGLVDLRGVPFAATDFGSLTPPLAVDDVPTVTQSSSCGHDVCVAGAALSSSCSSCAATVCAQDSYCCSSSWDSSCVSLADTYCGVDCGGDSPSSCAHDECLSGTALSSTCSSCAAAVCAQDSYCCTSSWDSTCVGLVPSACGFSC